MEKIDLIWSQLAPLTKESIEASKSALAGVFRLSYLHDDKKIYVFYVNQSENIYNTLLEILKEPNNDCVKFHVTTKQSYFKFAAVEQKNIRELVFHQIYKFYQPSCNEPISVSEDKIQVNVN